MKRKRVILFVVFAALAAGISYLTTRRARQIVLTGMVTTDQVIVSSEIQGRLQRLLVNQGDTVTNHELVAIIRPQEQQADLAFYASSEQQSAAQVAQAEADLRFQEGQTTNQIRQAEANLAATQAQVAQAEADLEIARLNFKREKDLHDAGVDSAQAYDEARTTYDSARARVETVAKQAEAARSAVALRTSNEDPNAPRRAARDASRQQLSGRTAQKDTAGG